MFKYWRYAVVALVAVLISSTTVAAAQPLKGFFIGSADGQRTTEVTADGRLLVDAGLPAVQDIQGNVNIGNLPAIQAIQGNVDIGNFPAVQDIQGNVNVANFPESSDLPDPATIVNLKAIPLLVAEGESGIPQCDPTKGFQYVVPANHQLLITDVLSQPPGDTKGLWTESEGMILVYITPHTQFTTPLIVKAGDTLCPVGILGDPTKMVIVTGRLVSTQ